MVLKNTWIGHHLLLGYKRTVGISTVTLVHSLTPIHISINTPHNEEEIGVSKNIYELYNNFFRLQKYFKVSLILVLL